jgi:MHS family proline/betaine transporter-like MFS transporter
MVWYDFGLFGYFAPVIARQFFPPENEMASLLGTFGLVPAGELHDNRADLAAADFADALPQRVKRTTGRTVMVKRPGSRFSCAYARSITTFCSLSTSSW